jgi:Dirigent-like protein
MATFTRIIGQRQNDEVFVGANKNKPRAGDEILFIERPLLDPSNNQQVGSFNARLKVMQNSGGVILLSNNADNELQGGVISTQGPLRTNAAQNVFAIVGGTGQYDQARGTVTVQTVGGKEQVTFNVL